jgi:uncharacterized protein YegP (UPF0339 family)
MTYIEVFEGADGRFYWRMKAANHEVVAQSEAYTRRWSAKRAARRFNVEIRETRN